MKPRGGFAAFRRLRGLAGPVQRCFAASRRVCRAAGRTAFVQPNGFPRGFPIREGSHLCFYLNRVR